MKEKKEVLKNYKLPGARPAARNFNSNLLFLLISYNQISTIQRATYQEHRYIKVYLNHIGT